MRVSIEILGKELTAEFDTKVTFAGAPATGPSYSSGGEPAEPMEYDIDGLTLYDKSEKELETPDWLRDVVIDHLHERDDVYASVQEAMDDGDPDFERDMRNEDD